MNAVPYLASLLASIIILPFLTDILGSFTKLRFSRTGLVFNGFGLIHIVVGVYNTVTNVGRIIRGEFTATLPEVVGCIIGGAVLFGMGQALHYLKTSAQLGGGEEMAAGSPGRIQPFTPSPATASVQENKDRRPS